MALICAVSGSELRYHSGVCLRKLVLNPFDVSGQTGQAGIDRLRIVAAHSFDRFKPLAEVSQCLAYGIIVFLLDLPLGSFDLCLDFGDALFFVCSLRELASLRQRISIRARRRRGASTRYSVCKRLASTTLLF